MEYSEEDFLPLSSLMHFAYCPRRWALIHIERQWSENLQTAQGRLMHETAHGGGSEKRGDLLITRAVPVFSRTLGLRGECDVVEWRASSHGVPLSGRDGSWMPCPVEYKRGKPAVNNNADALQLCAQALCLEEMVACSIDVSYLFYGEVRRRVEVALTDELRAQTRKLADEMHQHFARHHTPMVKSRKRCKSCSLSDICLPQLVATPSVSEYLQRMIGVDVL